MRLNIALAGAIKAHKQRYKRKHKERVVDQFIEESGELVKELLKRRRGQGSREYDIAEELADVLLCVAFLQHDQGLTQAQLDELVAERAEKLTFICLMECMK